MAAFFEAVAAHFFHGRLALTQPSEQLHLFHSILLANSGHCKSYVDEHPITHLWQVFEQQAEIDPAADAGDLNDAQVWFVSDGAAQSCQELLSTLFYSRGDWFVAHSIHPCSRATI
jgi:hypothetical protein